MVDLIYRRVQSECRQDSDKIIAFQNLRISDTGCPHHVFTTKIDRKEDKKGSKTNKTTRVRSIIQYEYNKN